MRKMLMKNIPLEIHNFIEKKLKAKNIFGYDDTDRENDDVFATEFEVDNTKYKLTIKNQK